MLSLIVPTHNRRALLEKKLRGLEEQAGHFEVVVVADGCTDDTLTFLRGYQPPYPLRVLETPGLGAAGARNRGVEAAEGEVILFSDDDVMLMPGCVAAHQQAHARASRPTVFVGKLRLPKELKGSGAAEMLGPRAFWWNFTGNNSSLPKALLSAVGGYDAEGFAGYGGEDPDLGYRLMRAGARFVFLPEAEALHEAWAHQGEAMRRARRAGAAHMRVYRKYGDSAIAWALGVHPVLLALKMAVLPWAKPLLGPRGDFELAYAWGAWEEYQAPR
ncbi:glycosyltransferase [Meiothermus sp. QL-1]|nr:glycosyltransferase [Meiothermus sp. QL-1]